MSTTDAKALVREPAPEASLRQFASDVRYYLNLRPRQLPSRYLYDALGSSLFHAICHLPWYHVTRAEMCLLTRHAREIVASLAPLERIVELGSGSGDKLSVLLSEGHTTEWPLDLHLIDVSAAALSTAARALSIFDGVRVVGHQAPYEVGLDEVSHQPVRNGRTLMLFLGSNIGNFDAPGRDALLGHIRRSLRPGDGFLLGADLVKPESELLRAYDDPLGVTAAFNLNLLARLNRELGADIDLRSFRHRAIWNHHVSRVEMHLVSLRPQRLRIPGAQIDIVMAEGDTIWTESSYKYEAGALTSLLAGAGFYPQDQWVDDTARFALSMAGA